MSLSSASVSVFDFFGGIGISLIPEDEAWNGNCLHNL
jgi:hypothetical protein